MCVSLRVLYDELLLMLNLLANLLRIEFVQEALSDLLALQDKLVYY